MLTKRKQTETEKKETNALNKASLIHPIAAKGEDPPAGWQKKNICLATNFVHHLDCFDIQAIKVSITHL